MREYSEKDFDGFSAAPLAIVGNARRPFMTRRQDKLAESFMRASKIELSSFVKPSVVSFVGRSIVFRMWQREGLNGNSYVNRKYAYPNLHAVEGVNPIDIWRACYRAQYGGARVRQNNIARKAYGMPTGEFANLTVINEFRKDIEPYMWDEVSDFTGVDATPIPEQVEGLSVLAFDRDIKRSDHIGAMRIGMKRKIATLDDGMEVKARTFAIINTSKSSGFDQSLVELFRETENPTKDVPQLPEFQRAISWLISNEVPTGLVLARNETVYGVKPS